MKTAKSVATAATAYEKDKETLHTCVDGKFLPYVTVMEWWCRYWANWAKEKEIKKGN